MPDGSSEAVPKELLIQVEQLLQAAPASKDGTSDKIDRSIPVSKLNRRYILRQLYIKTLYNRVIRAGSHKLQRAE